MTALHLWSRTTNKGRRLEWTLERLNDLLTAGGKHKKTPQPFDGPRGAVISCAARELAPARESPGSYVAVDRDLGEPPARRKKN